LPLDEQKLYAVRRILFGSGFTAIQNSDAANSRMVKSDILLDDLGMKLEGMHPNRAKFLEIIGLPDEETKEKSDLFGPLDDLKASNLQNGPFKIELTEQPSEHLTFCRSHGKSTIRLLKIEIIKHLYVPQRTSMARYFIYIIISNNIALREFPLCS
jgi:hypothetical protein